jgi:hypothetical protein
MNKKTWIPKPIGTIRMVLMWAVGGLLLFSQYQVATCVPPRFANALQVVCIFVAMLENSME